MMRGDVMNFHGQQILGFILIITFSASSAWSLVSVRADYNGCNQAMGSIGIDVNVNNEFKYFRASCDWNLWETFYTREGDTCRLTSPMCRMGGYTAQIEVQCNNSGYGSTTIACPSSVESAP